MFLRAVHIGGPWLSTDEGNWSFESKLPDDGRLCF